MERDPYYDNGRFLLILLVVAGHVVSYMRTDSVTLRSFFVWIHLFHMPMFVLVSGCLSRADRSLGYAYRNAGRLLLPYLVFETAALVMESLRDGQVALGYHLPRSVLWYLISLFCWRLMLPHAVRFRWALPASIVIALLCGYCPWIEWHFSLSRTLVFFPFFLVGYSLRNGMQQTIRRVFPAYAAGAVLIVTLLASYLLVPASMHWFYGSVSYASMGHTEWYAAAYRAGILAAGFLIGFAFMRLVPGVAGSITKMGSRTLYVYLLHEMFVLQALKAVGLFRFLNTPERQWLALWPLSILITLALSTDLVVKLTKPAVDPLSVLLKLKDRLAQKRAAA